MPVIVSQIVSGYSANENEIILSALKKISVNRESVIKAEIYKSSLDARDKSNIKLVSSVWLKLNDPDYEKKLFTKYPFCKIIADSKFKPEHFGNNVTGGRIIIAGFGPAGMFAALTLAEYGYNPLVLERGGAVDERVKAVADFWKTAVLDERTNVQFGEGGAGTFSDGKLTTRINDPLCRHILEKFAEYGAPSEILSKAKPHIGTDKLRETVKNIRQKIITFGGEVRFHSQLTDINILDGKVNSVTVNGSEDIKCCDLILSIGHSARDTFKMLLDKGVYIEPKPFSIGARIEHTQEAVNRSLYGNLYNNPLLPKGEYQHSLRKGDRAVYTFCMCPGGYVVPSQSVRETIVVNGMSEFTRDGVNANSALVVSVSPGDFGNSPLAGVNFANDIEKKAFQIAGGNYCAPVCTVGRLLNGNGSMSKASIIPSYSIGTSECDLSMLFPDFVTDMMRAGIKEFSLKMKCFGDRNAVMTAPETRTSSPVRIKRNDDMQSVSVRGLYPCGEGAGYAGGIVSAAVDGVNAALKIIEIYKPLQ